MVNTVDMMVHQHDLHGNSSTTAPHCSPLVCKVYISAVILLSYTLLLLAGVWLKTAASRGSSSFLSSVDAVVYESLRGAGGLSTDFMYFTHGCLQRLTEVKFTAAALTSSFNPSQRSDGKFKLLETKDGLLWTLFERLKTILLLGWIDYINGICMTAI